MSNLFHVWGTRDELYCIDCGTHYSHWGEGVEHNEPCPNCAKNEDNK